MGFGIPITIRGWDFFLKLGLKDNLRFVWLIGRGGVLLWIGCFWLLEVSMVLLLFIVWVVFLSLGSPWVPITMGSKSCGFGKGVG